MRSIFFLFVILVSAAGCSRRKPQLQEPTVVVLGAGDTLIDGEQLKWQLYTARDSVFQTFMSGSTLRIAFSAPSQAALDDSTFVRNDYSAEGKLVMTKSFRRGKPHGTWISWHGNGKKASESELRDGVLVSYYAWYPTGEIQVQGARDAGGQMARREFFDNGNTGQEFITDTLGNGICRTWWRNGQPREEGPVIRFAPAGRWKRFDTLGKPLPDTIYGPHDVR